MPNPPSLEPRLIHRTPANPRAWILAGLFLLGGCQELSCALSSDIDGLASLPGADESEQTEVESEAEVVAEAAPAPTPTPTPTPSKQEPEQSSPAAPLVQKPDATLVHFKAFAEDGWRATLSAKIDLRVPDAAEAERLSVHGKARCHAEGTIETSTASVQVSRLDSWDLDFFSGHDDVPFDQCQIDLRLGGDSGALYAPLGTFCYANDATSSGPCAQPVTIRLPQTTKPGLEMLRTSVKLEDGLEVDFEMQPTRNAGHELEVVGRTVCKVGEQHYMESGSHSFEGGAFDFEPGEVYGGEFTVFDADKWSDLALKEATCQLSFEAKDMTLYGDEHAHRFHTACLTEGTVETGPCKGFPAAAFAEADGLDALEVNGVDAAFSTSRYSAHKALRFSVEFIANGPVGGSIYSEVECQTDKGLVEPSTRWDGTDPVDLRAGESAKVWLAPFGDAPPADTLKWCQMKLTLPGNEEPWAQYCWNGRRTKAGTCG